MEIVSNFNTLLSDDHIIHHDSTGQHQIRIRAHLAIVTDKFVDYQKDLLSEFILQLTNESEKTDTTFRKFKNYVEFALQELNSKLAVFAEKVTDTSLFDIRGVVEVFCGHEYLASLIGDVSFMILRQNKIYYSLFNETSKRMKISLFSDFIEGDVSNGDQIVVLGGDIGYVVDERDLTDLSEVVGSTDKNFIELLQEVIAQRAGEEVAVFDLYTTIKSDHTSYLNAQQGSRLTRNLGNWLILNQYQVGMIIFGCVIAGLIYSIVSNYRAQYSNNIVTTPEGETVDITLESIKKDIAVFQRLDASSPNKISSYQDIKNKIDLLEKTNQSPLDIQQLKKVLQEEYYKGFRINTVSQFDTKVLDFNDSDSQILGDVLGIYIAKEGYHVAGSKAALLSSVNNQFKGTLIRYGENILSDPLKGCAPSLGRVGLYCFDAKGQVYLLTKSGIEAVQNAATATNFPAGISAIGTFASTNMYVLTKSPQQGNTHIFRYQAIGNNPTNLKEPQLYSFAGSGNRSLTSMAIDGTFIIWNSATNQLIQFRRDGVTPQDRVIPVKGGDNIDGADSVTGISVIAYDNSKYVYLWDAPQQSLTVFTSNPSKTNANQTTSFTLEYVMRLRFDPTLGVKGVIISDDAQPKLWAVTSNGVSQYNLNQDIDQYLNAAKQ